MSLKLLIIKRIIDLKCPNRSASLSDAERLFSHAEIFKYVFKYLVCGYFADDVVEVEDAFAEVLADEVAWEIGV